MSKRIVSVLHSDYVNDNRVFKMATSLAESGLNVTIVAMKSERTALEEQEGKVRVRRIRVMGQNLKGVFGHLLRTADFMRKVAWRYHRADVWHCNDFRPFLFGLWARMFNRELVLVYDCHELESERNGLPGIEKKIVKWVEKRFIHKHWIIHVAEGIQEYYEQAYPKLKRDQSTIIYNAPHLSPPVKREDLFRKQFGIAAGASIFIYQGGFIAGRGVEMLIEAFSGLPEAHLVFMGYGKLQPLVEEAAKASNMHFQPAVPYHEVVRYTSSADFGLISVENICLSYYHCMPNKLFEYIQSEIPILANDLLDCRNFLEKHGIGKAVENESAEAWRTAIKALAAGGKDSYAEALQATKRRFHWEQEEAKLLAFYQRVLAE